MPERVRDLSSYVPRFGDLPPWTLLTLTTGTKPTGARTVSVSAYAGHGDGVAPPLSADTQFGATALPSMQLRRLAPLAPRLRFAPDSGSRGRRDFDRSDPCEAALLAAPSPGPLLFVSEEKIPLRSPPVVPGG